MKSLFDRTRLNRMILRNRLVRSATHEQMATSDGRMTEQLFRVYERLSTGKVGLIITGFANILENEQPNLRMMGMYDDRFIEDFRPMAEMVHRNGSSIVLQIAYGGAQTRKSIENRSIWGPSEVAERVTGLIPREMTRKEIRTLVKAFGDAAVRARKTGFDGVQLHSAHGYLLSQFLSPYHNRRTDAYGGCIENRARIIFETYEEVRSRVGPEFGVLIKINSEDFVENGATFDACRFVCRELSRRGIDAIEISGGVLASGPERFCFRPAINSTEKEAYFAGYASVIAEENDTPVILVGGLRSPEVIEELLGSTKISYFAMSRPFLTEPELVKRWEEGDRRRAECVSCNLCRDPEGNDCVFNRRRGSAS